VDTMKFAPIPRADARAVFDLPADARVLLTVGGLVERKGFHRVIACIPELLHEFPTLQYIAVGAGGPEGDYSATLHRLVAELGVGQHVRFLGSLPPERVAHAISAADVFVLATSNEGSANVLLEALACGVPVVTTDVGGNRAIVCRENLGTVVPFGDDSALYAALRAALQRQWDPAVLRAYAQNNSWAQRVPMLLEEFAAIQARRAAD
jgi:teichuronic acid biosynthesis glycosyltransferase TuaC